MTFAGSSGEKRCSKMTHKRFSESVGGNIIPRNYHLLPKSRMETPAGSPPRAAPKWVPGATLQAASCRSRTLGLQRRYPILGLRAYLVAETA